MTHDETLEQIRSFEQNYRDYRKEFEGDGTISADEKALLDRIDAKIKKLRATIEKKASAEAAAESSAAGLKAELQEALRRDGGGDDLHRLGADVAADRRSEPGDPGRANQPE